MTNTFRVQLLAADRGQILDDVVSFVGEDASGSFGLMAHHARFMTALTFGLARLRKADGTWQYAGLPGGLLYFVDNELRISTRRYVMGGDAAAIAGLLAQEMLAEEQALAQTRRKLRRLEAQMLERLAQLGQEWPA
jgi:F-type H+-transporting ATPase subunit epsilon